MQLSPAPLFELARLCYESAHDAGFSKKQRPTVAACLGVLYDSGSIELFPSWEEMEELQAIYRQLWKRGLK